MAIQRTPTGYNPSKYPIPVSEATGYYGEYDGYIFDPWQGEYFPDKNARNEYYENTGLKEKEPKKPGMMESMVVPAAVTAGTYALGQAGASYLGAGGAGAGTAGTAGTAATGSGMLAGEAAGTTAGTAAGSTAGTAAGAAPAAPTIVGAETLGGSAGGATGGGTAGAGMGALATGATVGALGAYAGWQGMQAYSKLQNEDTRSEGALQGYLLSNPFTFWLAPFADKAGLKDNRWKDERKKFANLAKKDVFIPEPVIASLPTHARSLSSIKDEIQATLAEQQLPPDFVGFDNNGNWINARFAETRDVKDLRAEDIANYATFAEKDPDWFKKPLQERLNVANAALQAGAVKEGRGTISVDWNKFDKDAAASQPYQGIANNPTLMREQGQEWKPPAPQQQASQTGYRDDMQRYDVSDLMLRNPSMTREQAEQVAAATAGQGASVGKNPGMLTNASPARAMEQPNARNLAKGVRVSPGIYADGKGGTYRK